MELDPVCQVCFTDSQPSHPNNPLLSCKSCSATAHRFCYSPQSQEKTFICDSCKHGYHGKCSWCQNPGLLKKIGQNYGHPICLLFNSGAIVSKFSDLSFLQVESHKFRKLKCDHCQTVTGSVLRCCMNCQRQTHIYCALKSSRPEEGKGWRVCLQPLDGFRSYQEPYENLLLRSIRGSNHFLANQLGVKKSMKTIEVGVMLYCEDHSVTIVECSCREFDETKLEWLYCDSCCRWQHLECVKASESTKKQLKESKDLFMCHECQEWRLWLKDPCADLPNQLPKLHIYDYIFLNTLVQLKGEDTPPSWVDFLKTIPMMPGMAYAQLFFKRQIAKKLRNKIDLPFLKSKVEEFEYDRDKLGAFLVKNRSRLELVWLLVQGSIFGGDGKHFAYILQDEEFDATFLDKMLDLLHQYQVKYYSGKSQVFAMAKKTLELNPLRAVKEPLCRNRQQPKSPRAEPQGSHTKIKVQQASECEKSINEKEKRQLLIKDVAEAFDQAMADFDTRDHDDQDFLLLFEKLHAIVRRQGVKQIMQEMPMNLFARSVMLFQCPSDSSTFMRYIAHINHLQQEWHRLKDQNQGAIAVRDVERVEELSNMGSYLKEIIYSLGNDLVRSQLIKQLLERESEGNFPTISVYQYRFGFPREEWKTIPDELMSIKELSCILKVKELNNERPPRLYLTFIALQKLKKVKLTPKARQQLIKGTQQIRKLSQPCPEILKIIEQFHLIYQQTSKLLIELKVRITPSKCLIECLSQVRLGELLCQRPYRDLILAYLGTLGHVRLSVFSSAIQKVIKDIATALLQCFEQGKAVIALQRELNTIRNWIRRLNLKMPRLQELIQRDIQLCSQFVCVKPQFENTAAIEALEKELNSSLTKFGANMFAFRSNKIKMILEWIKAYRLIVNRLPLEYFFSEDKSKELSQKDKPSVIMMTRFSAILDKMNFPEGAFKAKLGELVQSAQKLKEEYDNLMAPCNWGYLYGESESNWDNKLALERFEEFIKKARLLPLCMQVQILECEIIIQKFKDTDNMAGLILAQSVRHSSQVPSKQQLQRIRQALTHFGCTPISSQRSSKLLQLMIALQQPKKLEMQAQLLFNKITKSKEKISYSQVCQLIALIQGRTLSTRLDISLLQHLIAPISQCFENYQSQLIKFAKAEIAFNSAELTRLRVLRAKTYSTHIFEDALTEMTFQLSLYEYLTIKSHKFASQDKKRKTDLIELKELDNLLNTLTILHPCFQTEQLNSFKYKIVQISQHRDRYKDNRQK